MKQRDKEREKRKCSQETKRFRVDQTKPINLSIVLGDKIPSISPDYYTVQS